LRNRSWIFRTKWMYRGIVPAMSRTVPTTLNSRVHTDAMKRNNLDALLFPAASGAAIAAKPGYPTVIVPFTRVVTRAWLVVEEERVVAERFARAVRDDLAIVPDYPARQRQISCLEVTLQAHLCFAADDRRAGFKMLPRLAFVACSLPGPWHLWEPVIDDHAAQPGFFGIC
jgi:hypothetical protein